MTRSKNSPMQTSLYLRIVSVIGLGLTVAACDPSVQDPDPALANLPIPQLLQRLETSHELDSKRIAVSGYLSPEQVGVVHFKVANSTAIIPLFSQPGGQGRKLVSIMANVRITGSGQNRSFELHDNHGQLVTGEKPVRVVGTVHYFNRDPKTPPPSRDQLSAEQKQNPAIREALEKLWAEYEQQKAKGELLDFTYVLQDVTISPVAA